MLPQPIIAGLISSLLVAIGWWRLRQDKPEKSFFWLMFALTNFFLAVVAYYFPVGLAIAFSVCFPLTFGLKNLSQLIFAFDRKKDIFYAILMQFWVPLMLFGTFGTLFLLDQGSINWLVSLPLAASVSWFNAINWHKYLIISRGGGSSRSSYGSSYGGSSGNGSSGGDSGGGFGGGSTHGGGDGGGW